MGDAFRSALDEYQTRLENPKISTGSRELDTLIGGVEAGQFYLLYDDEKVGVADRILHVLLVNCLKPRAQGGFGGKALYLNCGNYKRTRTMFNIELITSLVKEASLDIPTALDQIYTISAFSEDQQIKAANTVVKLLEEDRDIRLIAVQQIAKLFSPPLFSRGGDKGAFQQVVLKLKQVCVKHGAAFIATCRPGRRGVGRIRWPEGGGYLKHEAGIIVYFRPVDGEDLSATAYLLKHPGRGQGSCKTRFERGDEGMGRITKSFRERLQKEMARLKRSYREALKEGGLRKAFDEIWESWAKEEGAMIHANLPTALDVLLLTAIVDTRREVSENRRSIEELRREMKDNP